MQLGFPNRRAALALFLVAGLIAGAVSWAAGQSQNFETFGAAARTLLAPGGDLYAKNAADTFKYSPTFALLFVPFTWGPGWLLAPLWCALNFGVTAWGLDRLLSRDPKRLRIAQVTALAGIVIATDGDQSNLLVAGAAVLAFVAYEKGRVEIAAHLVAAATLVKIFPVAIAALVMVLPRDKRMPALLSLGRALLVWITLPLVVIGPAELVRHYASWHAMLGRDHGNHGWSVMSLLQDGLGFGWSTSAIQMLAIAAQALPIVMGAAAGGTDGAWRRTLVCSLLCFTVLFNHRAEYATFAISSVAVGIWLSTSERRTPLRWALVMLAILAPGPFFTRVEPGTDGIVAMLAAHRLFHPLRVLPLLLIWLTMQHELLAPFFDRRAGSFKPWRNRAQARERPGSHVTF